MSTTTNRGYWQLPVGMLAGMELGIFGAALGIAVRLLEFIDTAVPTAANIGGSLPAALLFLTVMCIAMAAMGLYNVRQVLKPAGLLVRITVAGRRADFATCTVAVHRR
jgi:hypothetical protein